MKIVDVWVNCVDEDEAKRISDALIDERLAACSNIFTNIQSRYYWKGRIENTDETPLLMKTAIELVDVVEERVRQIHSYETPSIIRIEVDSVNQDYLEWVYDETIKSKDS